MAMEMSENVMSRNVLTLRNIRKSENYTCQAQSTLGIILAEVQVKVQGEIT